MRFRGTLKVSRDIKISFGGSLKIIVISLLIVSSIISGCRPDVDLHSPTQSPLPTTMITPRWEIYEAALLKATIGKEDGVCEWSILGNSGKEIYVYVKCKLRGKVGTAMSAPAVIYLGQEGGIEKVTIPRDGKFYPMDIEALFPPDIQARIFAHDTGDSLDPKYLESRLFNGGPPLIVLSGTPLP